MEIPTAMIALGMLGFEVARGVTIYASSTTNQQVSHVLVNENGLRIGINQNAQGQLELLVDEEELREKEGIEIKELETELQKNYQYVQLMDRLKAEGYTIVEETEEAEDTVRVLVRRWR